MFATTGAVLIDDEFLRDGLQNESRAFSLAQKLGFVTSLEQAGVRRVELGSFVHPELVPQMADTDALFAAIIAKPGVTYTALILNMAGLERALSAGIAVRAGIQSALGCGFKGRIDPVRVLKIARSYGKIGVHEVNIADTTDLINPVQVHDLCRRVRDVLPDTTALSLHLHDTCGLGLANMLAGLQAGTRIFDAALGGLGGCPFIPAATGNIATEDAVFALSEMGFATGIDWRALIPAVHAAEAALGRRLPDRMAHLANPEARA